MRAPNYTLDEDLALVEAYIDFGGDGAIGKTKNPFNRKQHSLQNRLLTIRKETRNFVCLMGKFYRKLAAHQARIEYLRLYRKSFPHEETYKLFKYVKGFDYTNCTNEDEEEIPVAPIPTIDVDGENEEEEGYGGEEENEEKADDEEIPVPPIHPPYKPTPVVDIEEQQKEDDERKDSAASNTTKNSRRPNMPPMIIPPPLQLIQYSLTTLKKKMRIRLLPLNKKMT
ncbi:hypothetical protein MKW94_026525 [Papaver nudicaule]|uniref:Uncharacterized protein n=1 Tax=Papaver nudicaule TaxID=74823 RepID=A0AA41V4K6_PAPNU|nr:hypothetical protein [Papaver nudicaule]